MEAQNFSVRKHLLEYDDVMNKQRENVYALRRELLEGTIRLDEDDEDESREVDTRAYLMTLAEGLLYEQVETICGSDVDPEEWDLDALRRYAANLFGLDGEQLAAVDLTDLGSDEIGDVLWGAAVAKYEAKEAAVDTAVLRRVERDIMLQVVDVQWKDHLYSLDHLKEGISLRGYGQRNPLVEYKRESFEMFRGMKERIDEEIVKYLWRLRPVARSDEAAARQPALRRATPLSYSAPAGAPALVGAAAAAAGGPRPARTGGDDTAVRTVRRQEPKVGRNDPCPCGSGRKYKKCHGA